MAVETKRTSTGECGGLVVLSDFRCRATSVLMVRDSYLRKRHEARVLQQQQNQNKQRKVYVTFVIAGRVAAQLLRTSRYYLVYSTLESDAS
jgi:hypothetical protein